ncbi:pseudaminic acid synthase [Lysinibacillus fusiformis]|uniref:Pseudaminic acid synthase n=1 Tax=Lysinibacillus fusiformis TaxID=28031 RepID=A0A1H9M120_9BACI|nr:pseudaminic acid synthase [Lysinibacillus fusiformis]SCY58435.1 pseudaminic acid synthase [Lysinibacillus fusiformis]SEO15796.1 pseudaminic acid synthase [Lysinibacillus fusiformis]SER17378.1 pseudaminic acid synthase [Lysinibacillus fusiformis]
MSTMTLQQLHIGSEYKPFIIAEMSGNHNQSLERALEIVEVAVQAGAQALKIQTYTADTMTLNIENPDFLIDDKESLWDGQNLYKLYQQAYTPWEWHKPIFDRAKELGIIAFSTPFDETAVDFLEELDVPLYKIASFENNDIPLIRKVAKTGKPIIISTGMATLADLELLINTVKSEGNNNLVLLKCTSTYPATPENTNIATIPHLKAMFPDVQVGLSDHTMGIGVAVASVGLGATVIEKHFTLNREDGGVDAAFSMEPHEMESLVEETERAWKSLGGIVYGSTEKEKASLKFRRSIYVAEDMSKGDIITTENVRIVRPGYGLEPKYLDLILGKTIKQEVIKGTPLSWELVL